MFSNRELALLIWVIIFIIVVSAKNLIAIHGLLKILFSKTILSIFLPLLGYVALILGSFRIMGIWDFSMLKESLFWLFGSAFILLFNVNKAKKLSFFKELIAQNVKFILVLEFLINLYSFSLIVELALLPFLTLLFGMQIFAEGKDQYARVNTALKKLTSFVGLFLLIFVLYKTISEYDSVFTTRNAILLLLPPILTILLVPYLYGVALYISYETLFARLAHLLAYENQWPNTRKDIIRFARFRLDRINAINKNFKKFDYYHSTDKSEYIKGLLPKPKNESTSIM